MNEHEPSEELNVWAESLGEGEIDYLLDEAHRNLPLDQQHYSALDSRLVAIVGWAIVGVGTLLIAGDLDFDVSASGISAILVIVGASIVVLAGVYTLWPRTWASGIDLAWYSDYEWRDLRAMKARGLAALVHGAELNREVLKKRSRAFQVAAAGLVLEFAALVGTITLPPPSS